MNQHFRELDKYRKAAQALQQSLQAKGAKFSAWVVGEPTERPLPKVTKRTNRIRRRFLDVDWLNSQDQEHLRLRVYDADDEDTSEAPAGNGEIVILVTRGSYS